MKRIILLLSAACTLLSACATQEMASPNFGEQQSRSGIGGFCPPNQAIRGIC